MNAEQHGPPDRLPVSLPESLDFHCVQPYELDSLTHLVRPVSLAVASLATGCALGMIPLVRGALDAVGDVSKITNGAMLWYLIYAMIFALSSGVSVISAWINALRGRSDARRLLRLLRQRPNISNVAYRSAIKAVSAGSGCERSRWRPAPRSPAALGPGSMSSAQLGSFDGFPSLCRLDLGCRRRRRRLFRYTFRI